MARPPAAVILLPVALLGAHALAGGATAGVQWWHVLLAALGMLGAYVVMDPPRQRWQDLPVEPDESVDHDVIVVGRLHIRASVQGARACVCLLSVCRLALVRCAHSAGCRLSHTAISLFSRARSCGPPFAGAGCAGCALAASLVKGGKSVLLIEYGPATVAGVCPWSARVRVRLVLLLKQRPCF